MDLNLQVDDGCSFKLSSWFEIGNRFADFKVQTNSVCFNKTSPNKTIREGPLDKKQSFLCYLSLLTLQMYLKPFCQGLSVC